MDAADLARNDPCLCQAYKWRRATDPPAWWFGNKNKCGYVTQCPNKQKVGEFCGKHIKTQNWGVRGDPVDMVVEFKGETKSKGKEHLVLNDPLTHTVRSMDDLPLGPGSKEKAEKADSGRLALESDPAWIALSNEEKADMEAEFNIPTIIPTIQNTVLNLPTHNELQSIADHLSTLMGKDVVSEDRVDLR